MTRRPKPHQGADASAFSPCVGLKKGCIVMLEDNRQRMATMMMMMMMMIVLMMFS
jgi:hypothetical protein